MEAAAIRWEFAALDGEMCQPAVLDLKVRGKKCIAKKRGHFEKVPETNKTFMIKISSSIISFFLT